MREKLIELFNNVRGFPFNDVLADYLIANGVTFCDKMSQTAEIEELKADNERLRNMWAKAVSDVSKLQAENIKYRRMLDNAYEIIGKITDRYG